MRGALLLGLCLAGTALSGPAFADILQRTGEPAGAVIARKTGEEAKFIELPAWQTVDINQDVVPGDVLRTNANGNLAILFADRTQMRLGRNTTLLVKSVGAAADSRFELQTGTLWARAERGGAGLTVETPAAAAAIRGTDWTMSVNGDTTSLIVLEGSIEFSNPQGSVSLGAGEAASATIGQAPAKTIVTNSDDREQMLFYFSLKGRDTNTILQASTLPSNRMREERDRIAALPVAARSPEDWVTLAEVALQYDGPEGSQAIIDQAGALQLDRSQQARLDLVRANIAYTTGRFAEAARGYEAVTMRLDPQRRAVARFGGYLARSLADPDRAEQPPNIEASGPSAAIAEAVIAGYLNGLPAAVDLLKKAEQRYPNDPMLPAVRSRFALLLDDRDGTLEAIDRALALDPKNPFALETRSFYRAGIEGDLDGALADAQNAVTIAPGNANYWNTLGLTQSSRGANREALAAIQRAVELDPNDALIRSNLALYYLDQDRPDLAREHIDRALSLDPGFDQALAVRGRYNLQVGNVAKAQEDLLAATTANPADSSGLLLLAAAHYQAGDRTAGEQALDNAERLDPNSPVNASLRTLVAVDEYRADDAIANAQEALRRTRARGGNYAALSASQDTGSTLNSAFRLLGLDSWGRFYGDAVFDPFSGSSYFDQILVGSANPFINSLRFGDTQTETTTNDTSASSLLQGLLLSPQSIAGRSRGLDVFSAPFVETTIGGGFTFDSGNPGWNASLGVTGFTGGPIPTSFLVNLEGIDAGSLRGDTPEAGQYQLDDRSITGLGYIAARPTLDDTVVAYLTRSSFDFDLGVQIPADLQPRFGLARIPMVGETKQTNAGVAWSHTFGYRNVLSAGFLANLLDDESAELSAGFDGGVAVLTGQTIDADQQTYLGSLNHSIEVGDLTFRYGLEAGVIRGETDSFAFSIDELDPDNPTTISSLVDTDVNTRRAYMDVLYEITPDLKVEAGLFGTFLDGTFAGTTVDENRADPRFGVAWSPIEGQFLRAGFIRDASLLASSTLAPIGIVGLQGNQARLAPDGYADSYIARWDSQWTTRLFTAVEYQHQEFDSLTIGQPLSADAIGLSKGMLDRVSASANVWIGGGLGAFANYSWTDSENRDPTSAGYRGPLAFVPEHSARLGLTYVHPSNVRTTLAASYVGERIGSEGGTPLDGYWTADAFLTWEPFDRRMELELSAYNLFDETFEVAPLARGWGRTFTGTLKVRF